MSHEGGKEARDATKRRGERPEERRGWKERRRAVGELVRISCSSRSMHSRVPRTPPVLVGCLSYRRDRSVRMTEKWDLVRFFVPFFFDLVSEGCMAGRDLPRWRARCRR